MKEVVRVAKLVVDSSQMRDWTRSSKLVDVTPLAVFVVLT